MTWWRNGEKVTHTDVLEACKDVKESCNREEMQQKLDDLNEIRDIYRKQSINHILK